MLFEIDDLFSSKIVEKSELLSVATPVTITPTKVIVSSVETRIFSQSRFPDTNRWTKSSTLEVSHTIFGRSVKTKSCSKDRLFSNKYHIEASQSIAVEKRSPFLEVSHGILSWSAEISQDRSFSSQYIAVETRSLSLSSSPSISRYIPGKLKNLIDGDRVFKKEDFSPETSLGNNVIDNSVIFTSGSSSSTQSVIQVNSKALEEYSHSTRIVFSGIMSSFGLLSKEADTASISPTSTLNHLFWMVTDSYVEDESKSYSQSISNNEYQLTTKYDINLLETLEKSKVIINQSSEILTYLMPSGLTTRVVEVLETSVNSKSQMMSIQESQLATNGNVFKTSVNLSSNFHCVSTQESQLATSVEIFETTKKYSSKVSSNHFLMMNTRYSELLETLVVKRSSSYFQSVSTQESQLATSVEIFETTKKYSSKVSSNHFLMMNTRYSELLETPVVKRSSSYFQSVSTQESHLSTSNDTNVLETKYVIATSYNISRLPPTSYSDVYAGNKEVSYSQSVSTREALLFTNHDAGLFVTTTKIISSSESLQSQQSQLTASNGCNVLETISSTESVSLYFESQSVPLSNPTTILDLNLSFFITNHYLHFQSRSKMKDNNFIENTISTANSLQTPLTSIINIKPGVTEVLSDFQPSLNNMIDTSANIIQSSMAMSYSKQLSIAGEIKLSKKVNKLSKYSNMEPFGSDSTVDTDDDETKLSKKMDDLSIYFETTIRGSFESVSTTVAGDKTKLSKRTNVLSRYSTMVPFEGTSAIVDFNNEIELSKKLNSFVFSETTLRIPLESHLGSTVFGDGVKLSKRANRNVFSSTTIRIPLYLTSPSGVADVENHSSGGDMDEHHPDHVIIEHFHQDKAPQFFIIFGISIVIVICLLLILAFHAKCRSRVLHRMADDNFFFDEY